MRGKVEVTIPSGVQYSNFKPTYYFENEDERVEAFIKAEADLKYYHNITQKDVEQQKAGDIMEEEHRGRFVDGKYLSKEREEYLKFKKTKIYPEGTE